MYLLGILCLVVATAALPVLPDPPTLSKSVAALHQDSKSYKFQIQNASDSLRDVKDNEKVKKDMLKTASLAFSSPRQLPPFYDYILKKQKADKKQIYEDRVKQKAKNSKKEKESVIPEKSLEVEFLPDPGTVTNFKTGLQGCEVCTNILIVTSDFAPVADKKDDDSVKNSIVMTPSIYIPTPPSPLLSPLSQEKSALVEVPPNPDPFLDSVTASQDSEVGDIILSVTTDSAPVADKKDNEEIRHNMVKVVPVVIPPPPELPPFDYSILEKQKNDHNLKSEYSAKQAAEKYKKDKEKVILDLEKEVKVEVPPNPPTLPDSVLALPVSEVITGSDNVEDKINIVKVAPVVIPPPPELPKFDYSVLKNQIANQKQKYNDAMKQDTKIFKEEKKVVIPDLEKSVQVEVPTNPGILIESVVPPQNSEVSATILSATTESAPVADKEYDEDLKHNIVKIDTVVIPPPPELPLFDYSILRKQKLDLNLKSEYSAKQAAEKYKKDKETEILDLEKQVKVEVPPNPPALPDSVLALPVSEVITGSDNVEDKINIVKVAPVVIPPPPELPKFDYSVLKNQIANQKQKYNDAIKQDTKIFREEKKVVIPDLEKSVQVEVPTNPAILIESLVPPQNSEVSATILSATTESAPVADNEYDEDLKHNIVKIDTVIIPPPPELPPFDYSILEKQKNDNNLKSEYSAKQAAEKYKKDKETVILDLEKEVKVEVPPNPPTLPDSVLALPVSEVITGSDNVEDKINIVKVAPVVIPPPPELPKFDYSVLKNQIANQKQKYNDAIKQDTKMFREEKKVVIPDLEKSVQVEVPTNPAILIESLVPPQNLEVSATILSATTESAPVPDNEYDEDLKHNIVKIDTVVIPPPPELPPFDYSILRKQKLDLNLKSEYSAKQAAEKYKKDKETEILDLEKQVKVEVPPNPPALPDSVLALPVSEVITASDNVEDKINIVKVAPVVIPPPPELPKFDYSVLKNQIANQKQKHNDAIKQDTKIFREEKKVVIPDLEKSVQVEVPTNPATLIESLVPPQNSEVSATILSVTTESAPVPDNEYDEDLKHNIVKIDTVVIPPPPELPPFDYSILKKQKNELNLKSENSAKQAAEKYKKDKETVILDLEKQVKVEVPPNPPALPDSVLALPVSEVITGSDNVEDKINIVKVAPVGIPPPPELPKFDFSVLKNQIGNQKQKYNDALKQESKIFREEKKVVIPDLEKSVQIKVPTNPSIFIESVVPPQNSEVSATILSATTESASVTDKEYDEDLKHNIVKIDTVVIPPPPELPPFDYSILRKQKNELNLKSENSAKQAAEKYKKNKETVILDLEKEVKVEVPPNPPTLPDSVLALPVSEVITGSDNLEDKINMVKVTRIAIPPPPELPPFDYSILNKKQKTDHNLKSEYSAKQAAEKFQKDKEMVIDNVEDKINKVKVAPIAIPPPPELPKFDYSVLKNQIANQKQKYNEPKLIEESKFVEVSKPVKEFKPVEEFKPSEVIKEPLKHSEDIPVIIQLTIPSTPFLSKLISKCPPLPSFGLNWPFQRPSMSRCPRLIHPKFETDGKIYTN